jgi:hypothetical protein
VTEYEYLKLLLQAIKDGVMPSYEGVGGKRACRYRGPDGRRCAAGLLISDADYRTWMEGQTLGDEEIARCVIGKVEGMSIERLRAVQAAHDNAVRADKEHFLDGFLNGLVDRGVWGQAEVNRAREEVGV